MRAALLIGLCLLGTSCWKDLSGLAPFPCAGDGHCPGGLACFPGAGGAAASCNAAKLDGPCIAGGSDPTACTAAAPQATCFHTMCEAPCAGAVCPTGRVCAVDVCLLQCSADSDCPFGLACHSLSASGDGGSACMPQSVYVPACASFEASSSDPT